jgi:uncharacterized membrane protein YraQ (UPF0718 family)
MDPSQSDLVIRLHIGGHEFVFNLATFFTSFVSILYEAMPFIVLGALVAGLLEEFLPQRLITRFLPRSRLAAISVGALLGLIFPMCECGIVPVMRRLLRKGLPLSCCVAYMLAGPIINPIVLLSTFYAFNGQENTFEPGKFSYQMGGLWMMSVRAGVGFLVAVGTSLVVERLYNRYGNSLLTPLAQPSTQPQDEDEDEDSPKAAKKTTLQRLNNISEVALHDFIDITVFLIIGALLAAFARQLISGESIAAVSHGYPVFAILMMMLLALVLCLCSEADAFVAASFNTMRPASKVAFLVLGPMLDFKLVAMYTRVFRPRLIWTIIISVVIQVFLYSLLVHFLWETYAPMFMTVPSTTPIPGK